MANLVELKDVYKSYENGRIKALNGINLSIEEGEFVSIIGPSGSGKSTLLNMLGALDIPDSGLVKVAGRDLQNSKNLNEFRAKQIGFIFQLHNLIPNLTCVQNIEIPMYTMGMSSRDMRKRALDLLDNVGLKDKADQFPNKLSGGDFRAGQADRFRRRLIPDPSSPSGFPCWFGTCLRGRDSPPRKRFHPRCRGECRSAGNRHDCAWPGDAPSLRRPGRWRS